MKKNKKILIVTIILFSLASTVLPVGFSEAKSKKLSVTDIPMIYPRSSWSNSAYEKRTRKVWPPKYKDPKVIIVHHTATSYKTSTSKQIKKIYKYHSYTKKWGDIGYNYIIGEDGSIFQGRLGNNGVIGGHAYNSIEKINYNSGSIGIAVLGNYDNKKLSSAAQDSLEKLVGWLSANNDISVESSVDFHGKSLDNSVVGHRDVASTACPGKNINSSMSAIRSSAESLATTYRDYAYQVSGESDKYEISDGKRYSGSTKSSVMISKTQLDAYPLSENDEDASEAAYPSGTLVKVSAEGKRGIIENGILRTISSESALASSFNASSFVEISSEKWASYSTGAEAGFRDGAFVKDSNGNYFIFSGGQKRKLSLSSEDLELVNLGSAHDFPDGENAQYAEGEIISVVGDFPEGALLTSDHKNYFYVSGSGTKKKLSKNVFRATYSRDMAVDVSGKFLKKYKTSGRLSFQNGATVSYRGKYYFIENGTRRPFASKNLAASMGYKNILKAKRTEMAGIGNGTKIK